MCVTSSRSAAVDLSAGSEAHIIPLPMRLVLFISLSLSVLSLAACRQMRCLSQHSSTACFATHANYTPAGIPSDTFIENCRAKMRRKMWFRWEDQIIVENYNDCKSKGMACFLSFAVAPL